LAGVAGAEVDEFVVENMGTLGRDAAASSTVTRVTPGPAATKRPLFSAAGMFFDTSVGAKAGPVSVPTLPPKQFIGMGQVFLGNEDLTGTEFCNRLPVQEILDTAGA